MVGQSQTVMGIYLCGVETFLVLLYQLIVEARHKITLENLVRRFPIGIAMLQMIDVSVVIVTHLVPFDRQTLPFL